MTTIAPPWYNELADLIEESSIDSNIKGEVVDYIKGYNLGTAFVDETKKRKFNLVIKETIDKMLYKAHSESAVLLGKIERKEELSEEEKITFDKLIHLMFLWRVACGWYYGFPVDTEK